MIVIPDDALTIQVRCRDTVHLPTMLRGQTGIARRSEALGCIQVWFKDLSKVGIFACRWHEFRSEYFDAT